MNDGSAPAPATRVQGDRRGAAEGVAGDEGRPRATCEAMKPEEALTPEQRALKILQDAEQEYEMQVTAQQGGGGGGGGSSSMADDLADLFELELDKLANQYEMQKQAEQQQQDKQVDELAEKLKELARRQQQEAERQRRLARAGQQQRQGGGGSSQRAARARKPKKRRDGSSS